MYIRECRERAGVTQERLAAEIGVDRSAVAHWEVGDANPSAERLPRIADALGVSIDELVRGRGDAQ